MAERQTPGEGTRLVMIDVLRAVAISWVVLFHLWGDLEFFPGAPSNYYDAFTERVGGGDAWASFTAFTDLVFRLGFQGVPLFMIISGISLTIAAYRMGENASWRRFFSQRFRKLLIPYWVGVALTYALIAGIAWRQFALEGGTYADHFTGGVTISGAAPITIDWNVALASVGLLPRLTGAEYFFAPQLALWFVGLIAQYYLLFPILFVVMKRIGVPAFLLFSFAITVGANMWIVDQYGAPEFKFYMVTGWAPFRMFEFALGMAIGWLLVAPEGARWLKLARNPFMIAAFIAGGLAAHTVGGLMIGEWTLRYWQALALPLVTLGLGLLCLPLLIKPESRVDVSPPVRAVAALGVMSYAVLIVNDAMRLVASQLRVEDVSQGVWWTFLVLVYVPVSIALAYPLALALGLMPRRRPRKVEVAAAVIEQSEQRIIALAGGG